jgi:hypothetical protein
MSLKTVLYSNTRLAYQHIKYVNDMLNIIEHIKCV